MAQDRSATDDGDANQLNYVVVNDEEQYSIWPIVRPVPLGWMAVGGPRPKTECLDYIEEIWTDMRPASLRRWMEGSQKVTP